MNDFDLEEIELSLLLEAVHKRYGYQFRNYARASLMRRVRSHVVATNAESISALIPRVIHSRTAFESFLGGITVTVTEMFRDPAVYQRLRNEVIPWLRTFPNIRIWHAGCATGEEVYSMAILLHEEGLLDGARIYATDINPEALEVARRGIYPVERVQTYTQNYQAAGGRASFGDYYYADHGSAVIDERLRAPVIFASHNLVTDGALGHMHLIVCRNVFIYFDLDLQARVLDMFRQGLERRAYLCLGSAEHIAEDDANFQSVYPREKIYRLRAGVNPMAPRS